MCLNKCTKKYLALWMQGSFNIKTQLKVPVANAIWFKCIVWKQGTFHEIFLHCRIPDFEPFEGHRQHFLTIFS